MDTNTMYIEHYVDLHNYISDNIYELDDEIIYAEGKVAEFFTKVGKTIGNAWYKFIEWVFGFFKNGRDKKLAEMTVKKQEIEINKLNKLINQLNTKISELTTQNNDEVLKYKKWYEDVRDKLKEVENELNQTKEELNNNDKNNDIEIKDNEIKSLQSELNNFKNKFKELESINKEIKELNNKEDEFESNLLANELGIIKCIDRICSTQINNVNKINDYYTTLKRRITEYDKTENFVANQYIEHLSKSNKLRKNLKISIPINSIETLKIYLEIAKDSLNYYNAFYLLMINRYSDIKSANRELGELYNALINATHQGVVRGKYANFDTFFRGAFTYGNKLEPYFKEISFKNENDLIPHINYSEENVKQLIKEFIDYVNKHNKISKNELSKNFNLNYDNNYNIKYNGKMYNSVDIDKKNFSILKNNLTNIGKAIIEIEKTIPEKINNTYNSKYIKVSKELIELLRQYPALSPTELKKYKSMELKEKDIEDIDKKNIRFFSIEKNYTIK